MFRASLCPSSGEKTTCYCIWGIFAGSVGCGRLRYCGATLLGVSTAKVAAEQQQRIFEHKMYVLIFATIFFDNFLF